MFLRMLLICIFLGATPCVADERILYNFETPDAAEDWQTVNDGVMGGRSDGRFKINAENNMVFFGTLSLENNGGFASVRSSESKLGIQNGDTIVIRVRGDGRPYNLNLYVPRNVSRNSYRQRFDTQRDEWIEVTLPMEKFLATWRGQVMPNDKLDPQNISAMGFQLSDGQAGPFELEIDWIQVKSPAPKSPNAD